RQPPRPPPPAPTAARPPPPNHRYPGLLKPPPKTPHSLLPPALTPIKKNPRRECRLLRYIWSHSFSPASASLPIRNGRNCWSTTMATSLSIGPYRPSTLSVLIFRYSALIGALVVVGSRSRYGAGRSSSYTCNGLT